MDRNNLRHWQTVEDRLYYFFLVIKFNKHRPPNASKEHGFYNQMSNFIGKKHRTHLQCNSHHQKKLLFVKQRSQQLGLDDKIDLQLIILTNFYLRQYSGKLLGVGHLINEIKDILSERIRKQSKFKRRYEYYLENIDRQVSELMEEIKKMINKMLPYQQNVDKKPGQIEELPHETREQNGSVREVQEQQNNLLTGDILNDVQFYDFLQDNWLRFIDSFENNFVCLDRPSTRKGDAIQNNVFEQ